MLDYETYCQIRDHVGRQQLSVTQTATALGLDARTVAKWRDAEFRPWAAPAVRWASKLDPFKGQIVRWPGTHPYSAQQILQRLRELGFDGGRSIVKDYVARIRPRPRPAFLKLDFAPGECAQVDWGLCRARHRPHYAEFPYMPSVRSTSLVSGGLSSPSARHCLFPPWLSSLTWRFIWNCLKPSRGLC